MDSDGDGDAGARELIATGKREDHSKDSLKRASAKLALQRRAAKRITTARRSP